jgi:hypothetical protein
MNECRKVRIFKHSCQYDYFVSIFVILLKPIGYKGFAILKMR